MNFHLNKSCKYKKILFVVFILFFIPLASNAQLNFSESSSLNGLFIVSPKFSLNETWTDNLLLENKNKKSGWITQVSPGVDIRSGSGKIKGYLNYSLIASDYSGYKNKNSLQNSLNTSINIEAIDRHGFLDVSGVISQQTISAFSVQNSNLNNENSTEISTYRLTPYYRGNLSNFVNYEIKYSLTKTQVKKVSNFSSDASQASITIKGDDFFGKLSWALDANRQIVSRNNAPDTQIDNAKISINYPVVNKFIISMSGGREIQNYTSTETKNSSTSSVGLNWSISEMTKISGNIENNSLGKMHSLNFEHRTPRTSWKASDVKSVSISNGKSTASLGNNYDLLFIQFSSIEPDLIKRAQLVNNYMQTYGLSPDSAAVNGYLTSGTSLQRAQNISFALLGLRDTITFTATRSTGKSISSSNFLIDDFANSNSIKQSGFSAAYTHRLTKDTVVSNQISIQKTHGQLDSQNSEVRSANISASTRVGIKTYLTLSARHSISSSGSFPYKETAVTGNLTVQF